MKDIIDFWFNELQPEQWFTRDPQLDKHITERFLHAHQQAIQGKFSTWRQTAEGRLAEIIIIDSETINNKKTFPVLSIPKTEIIKGAHARGGTGL